MLEAKLEQAQVLKRVVEAIMGMVSDCNFDCSDTGISVQAMDTSHIALVSLNLDAESFKSYRSDRNMTLGMNIASLHKLLRCGGNDDELTLQAEDNPNVLSIVFEDTKQDKISEFHLKLMDIDQEHLSVPERDHVAEISLPSAQFQKLCRDLSAIDETIKIEAAKDGVRFSADGEFGDGAISVKPYTDIGNDDQSITINISEPVSLTFNLKYLLDICKAGSLSNLVTLKLSPEEPIEIEYKLPRGHLRYFLAPKIDDDN